MGTTCPCTELRMVSPERRPHSVGPVRGSPVQRGQCSQNRGLAALPATCGQHRSGIVLTLELPWGTTLSLNLNFHSHCEGAKNLSCSSLCPKAAVSLLGDPGGCCSPTPTAQTLPPCLQSPFLFSFLKRGGRVFHL